MGDQIVNGRRALLQCLDSLLAEEPNIRVFKQAFQARIDEEPMQFFKEIVMPLMPKDTSMSDVDDENNKGSITIEFKPLPPKE